MLRQRSSTGYRLRFSIRKSAGANGRQRFSTNTHRNIDVRLQESPNISRIFREVLGECSPGISVLLFPVRRASLPCDEGVRVARVCSHATGCNMRCGMVWYGMVW